MTSSCCVPSAGRPDDPRATEATTGAHPSTLIELPGGSFVMGDESEWAYPGDGEGPPHDVVLGPFAIDAHTVTNHAFAGFVDSTGHITDAERYGWSFVFGGFLPDEFPDTRGVVGAEWWRQVLGADWRHPEGPHSGIDDRDDHPVVHVSWTDARSYCAWSGTRLPTEAEWEYAARAGSRSPFPWGDDLEPGGEHRMNVFQGRFPNHNTLEDTYAGTAPVGAFAPNGFGLFNVTGNVWEWCADWFDAGAYGSGSRHDPPGPADGTHRVTRGGSYLCHESYCRRYRVSARQGSEPASSTGNIGFRVAADVDVP